MQLPIPYDWFVLISRLTVASLFILFLWQVLRALVQDAFASMPSTQLQLTPLNGSRAIPLRRTRPNTIGRDDDCDGGNPREQRDHRWVRSAGGGEPAVDALLDHDRHDDAAEGGQDREHQRDPDALAELR